MVVICGLSAWEYYRTPPIIREVELPESIALAKPPIGAGVPKSLLKLRKNACEASKLVSGRLLFDLKGVPLPIDVFVDECSSHAPNAIVRPHRMPTFLSKDNLIRLGTDLYITSPQATLAHLARMTSWQQLALFMLEACGLFAIFKGTLRSRIVLETVKPYYEFGGQLFRSTHAVAEFCDEKGLPLYKASPFSPAKLWTPSLDRFGRLTDLWKRPPLCAVNDIEEVIKRMNSISGAATARKALGQIAQGSGSPLEARLFLLLCASASCGGEHWERPCLNRGILFTDEAKRLSGQSHCACDFLWPDKHVAIETKGKAFHADKDGFEIDNGRRSALESMGYTVFDVIYRQIADCDQFETLLNTFSKRLGFSLRKRTSAFLKQRERLYKELFLHKPIKSHSL